jgi:hypothetical protein
VFTHHQILLSMPEVYLWLMITAVLSILVGVVRILTLKRERAS